MTLPTRYLRTPTTGHESRQGAASAATLGRERTQPDCSSLERPSAPVQRAEAVPVPGQSWPLRAVPKSNRSSPTSEPHSHFNEVFATVLDKLDQVDSLQGAQALRGLAERAEQVSEILEVASAEARALQELPEVADALDDLASHSDTLLRLLALADLADDVEQLVRSMRAVRHHRDEIEWAANEDWDTAKDDCGW